MSSRKFIKTRQCQHTLQVSQKKSTRIPKHRQSTIQDILYMVIWLHGYITWLSTTLDCWEAAVQLNINHETGFLRWWWWWWWWRDDIRSIPIFHPVVSAPPRVCVACLPRWWKEHSRAVRTHSARLVLLCLQRSEGLREVQQQFSQLPVAMVDRSGWPLHILPRACSE